MEHKQLDRFVDEVKNIRVHRSQNLGAAVKKPLLLLLVLSLMERHVLRENRIHFAEIETELGDLISSFGGRPTGSGPKPEQPFHHLGTAEFW